MTFDPAGALDELARRTPGGLPNLAAARERTAAALAGVRERLAEVELGPGVSVALFGSWGRRELTQGSDDDWAVLLGDGAGEPPVTRVAEVLGAGARRPGAQGVFGDVVACADLVERIGLDEDTNTNLTRRMLLMLESLPVAGDDAYGACWQRVLDRYLDESVKDHRPPRFFLNDVIRYWRTMTVDYVGKARGGGGKGAMRNVKLRTSRKVLFAGGFVPLLLCHRLTADEQRPFLAQQLRAPATDRLAAVFLEFDVDAGQRALGAYDRWLGMLDRPDVREELETLDRARADRSRTFREARRLGDELQNGLLALLFETPLRSLVREYGVF